MSDLLARLGMPAEDCGITFINDWLSAMPTGERSHAARVEKAMRSSSRKMWSIFGYMLGIAMVSEMAETIQISKGQSLQDAYRGDI